MGSSDPSRDCKGPYSSLHDGFSTGVDAQVGAGIVADSEPANEYQETFNKAQSMLNALQLAHAWAADESA